MNYILGKLTVCCRIFVRKFILLFYEDAYIKNLKVYVKFIHNKLMY